MMAEDWTAMTGRLVAMLLVGLAVGLAAGWAMFGGSSVGVVETGAAETSVVRAPQSQERVLPQVIEVPMPLRPGGDLEMPEAGDYALISERLFEYAEDTYLKARDTLGEPADSVSPDFRLRFEGGVLSLPGGLARKDIHELQRARTLEARQAAVLDDSGSALIEMLSAQEQGAEFSLEGDVLDQVVVNRGRGDASDGPAFLAGDEPVLQGLVISFPAGIHVLEERRLRGPRDEPFPTDVTLEGAGMNATLLRLSDISIRGDVERLTLRDMTIDCQNDGLFDLRTGNASLDLTRVRLVRFDAGHGGCTLFKANDGVVLVMSDSEVVGGFGSSPGDGRLLSSAGSPEYAMRFTNVLFQLVDPEFDTMKRGLFIGCRFELLTEGRMNGSKAMVFRDCTFGDLLPVNYDRAEQQRSLDDLFPGSEDD
jgi:hypothetical protein